MLEQIHFYTQQIHIPCTDKNFMDIVPFYYDETLVKNHLDSSPSLMKGSFYIDGTIHMCPPHPNTEYAEKHLFYIQSFSLMEVGAQYYTKRNGLNSYLLLYTYDGYGQLEYDGQIYELQEGDIFFIDCAKEHCYRSLGPIWKHGDLHINGAFIDGIFQELKNSGQLIFHRSLQDDFFKKMEELIELYDSIAPYRELQLSNRLENLLLSLLLDSVQYQRDLINLPDDIRYLVKYMEHNYMHTLTLDYLSDFAGISKFHLTRIFKKYVGYTPNDYLIQLRVEHAKGLLRTTSLPSEQIGRMVGIENENYFCRIFKSKTGVTPGKYRKQN